MGKHFNVGIYGDHVKRYIPNISEHDLLFVCNKAGNLYRRFERAYGCTDNFRVKRFNSINFKYDEALMRGCCGFDDVTYTNPHTGNSFVIGFNYGH